MATYRIAVLPGDGIGAEVTPEAIRVLEAVGSDVAAVYLVHGTFAGQDAAGAQSDAEQQLADVPDGEHFHVGRRHVLQPVDVLPPPGRRQRYRSPVRSPRRCSRNGCPRLAVATLTYVVRAATLQAVPKVSERGGVARLAPSKTTPQRFPTSH